MEIITLSSGEKADELRNKLLNLINEYSNILTGYELVGIIDVVKEDCHTSIQEMDEEWKRNMFYKLKQNQRS